MTANGQLRYTAQHCVFIHLKRRYNYIHYDLISVLQYNQTSVFHFCVLPDVMKYIFIKLETERFMLDDSE